MASRDLGRRGYYEGEEKPVEEKAGQLAEQYFLEQERELKKKIAFGLALILLLVFLYLVSSGSIKIS